MGKRHRATIVAERAPKRERRWTTHQERRAVRAALITADDPEDIVAPRTVHHGPRSAEAAPAPRRQRMRHWKLKAWKRRSTMRRERAIAMAQLAEET